MSKDKNRKFWLVVLLCAFPMIASGEVPHVFTRGTVISSAEVNENFNALSDRATQLESMLGAVVIPDLSSTAGTNPELEMAKPVHLPIYRVIAGENGTNEAGAACKTGDTLISGGCVSRDTVGTETCMVERSYPIDAVTWWCRIRKANGTHSECRASPIAICLKSN